MIFQYTVGRFLDLLKSSLEFALLLSHESFVRENVDTSLLLNPGINSIKKVQHRCPTCKIHVVSLLNCSWLVFRLEIFYRADDFVRSARGQPFRGKAYH